MSTEPICRYCSSPETEGVRLFQWEAMSPKMKERTFSMALRVPFCVRCLNTLQAGKYPGQIRPVSLLQKNVHEALSQKEKRRKNGGVGELIKMAKEGDYILDSGCAPWITELHRLFSLWELMNYDPLTFDQVGMLTAFRFLCEFSLAFDANSALKADDESKNKLLRICDDLQIRSTALKLDSALAQIDRIRFEVPHDDITFGDLHNSCEKLRERIEDELKARKFLFIPPASARRFENPLAGWTLALEAFPHAKTDIIAAGRCSALRCHTASVFHLMRVMECLLRVVSDELELNPGNSTWNSYLNGFRPSVSRKFPDGASPDQREWRAFYYGIEEHLRTIKDAWRNDTMHDIALEYDSTSAGTIYVTVFLLMTAAAAKLREPQE